jgi:nucleotide-binding universal stress UspA family protein
LTVHVNKRLERTFAVFHPSDFSPASDLAFAHALKIALQSKADFDLMHVAPSPSPGESDWSEFPGVRATLARWGVLPEGVAAEEVGEVLGLGVRKVIRSGGDPLGVMLAHLRTFAPDLIVLTTHQRDGVARWLHKSVAEPLARRSGAMTLFVPNRGHGFVSPEDGRVTLQRVLIPVDHAPPADTAIQKAWSLVRGLGCTTGEVRLIHVGDPAHAPAPTGLADAGWPLEMVVRQGDVVPCILEEQAQWGADLLVLATQGHQDFLDALRGSTTERVVRGARCPVLAVPDRPEPAS